MPFGSTSDLATFDWTTGSLWTLVQGNGGHSWEPRFWGSYTDLAYSDSRDGSRLYWIDVQTGRTPSEDPGAPLAGDPNRIASLIPAGLAPSWTGQYAVSADEELACGAATLKDIEDLSVAGMVQNRRMARGIADVPAVCVAAP